MMKGVLLALVMSLLPAAPGWTQPPLSDAEIERFLERARILSTREAGKGVAHTLRATLTDGTLTHDVHIQTIDEWKARHETLQGMELNFRDSWKYNVAGYRLDRLIGLNMVPVSVARRYRRDDASFTWWVDDVLADEGQRLTRGLRPPDPRRWQEDMDLMRLFDQLIYNVDRNRGNMLITTDWRVWLIDHTRAFRLHRELAPRPVKRCDRQVLEGLRGLSKPVLQRELRGFLTSPEIDALLARRDLILAELEQGPADALFVRSVR